MRFVTAVAVFLFGVFTTFAEPLLGSGLYGDPISGNGVYYDKPFKTFIKWANRCYRLDCDNLDNRVASARCAYETIVIPHNGGIREFHLKTVIGKISAFVVQHDSLNVMNEYGICTDVAAGYTRFKGEIKFFAGANYFYHFLTLKLDTSNRCYHFDCTLDEYIFDHRTLSANWTGLPTTGLWETAYIAFYATTNCTGHSEGTQLVKSTGGISGFPAKIRGQIMSFKVLADSLVVDRGVQAVCTGEVEEGADLTEDETMTTVV
ncbi:Hypothetical protein PHPALM_19693 [Phytophthora palmivora]|uniref:Uncharacterized protein n=1 Tax=Phytophthora palmivora TaxID=4796 RepID=A0A2P4XGS4_9STRA|nr:Hypothetical protein PHPALM_19693 [Phytophthora palmivora]